LKPREEILSVPHSKHLHSLAPSPCTYRPFITLFHNVFETSVFKVSFVLRDSSPIFPKGIAPFQDQLNPAFKRGSFDRIVGTCKWDDTVLKLEIAAWPEGMKSRLDDIGVRFEAGG
jgi:hypothetical protein